MRTPQISICSTVYNNRNRIEASLKSIVSAPGFDEKMELIVAENYSVDGTWGVLQEYARKHKNITVFREKCSIGYGRFLATGRAKGKFVMGVDLDTVYHPEFWKFIAKCASICKEDELFLPPAFMTRKTMERLGNYNKEITGTEDTELYARAVGEHEAKLYCMPATMSENEVVKGRRILRNEKFVLKKYIHALQNATGIIMGGGLKFSEIKARTPAELAVLRLLYIWILLTGKKIYRHGDMPNTDMMWNSIELLDPSDFGISKRYWLYYIDGKLKGPLERNVRKLKEYGFDKSMPTRAGVLMYTSQTDKALLKDYTTMV